MTTFPPGEGIRTLTRPFDGLPIGAEGQGNTHDRGSMLHQVLDSVPRRCQICAVSLITASISMWVRAIVSAVAVALCAANASADLITRSFSGTIVAIADGSTSYSSVGGISIGDAFTVTFGFDTDLASPDALPSPTTGFHYLDSVAPPSITFEVNGLAFSAGGGIAVVDTNGADSFYYGADGQTATLPAGWSGQGAPSVLYTAPAGTVLSNDGLPSQAQLSSFPDALADLGFSSVTVGGQTYTDLYFYGQLEAQAVPEPGGLLFGGIAGVLAIRRVSKTRRK